jgi:hypothetical protein
MNNDQLYFYNKGFNDCLAKGLDTYPAKTLTDEQIGWFAKAYTDRKGKLNIIDFARAILRKAQEK